MKRICAETMILGLANGCIYYPFHAWSLRSYADVFCVNVEHLRYFPFLAEYIWIIFGKAKNNTYQEISKGKKKGGIYQYMRAIIVIKTDHTIQFAMRT